MPRAGAIATLRSHSSSRRVLPSRAWLAVHLLLEEKMGRMVLAVAFTVAVASIAEAQQDRDPRVADVVQAGKIRIGVFPSTQYSKDSNTGIALDISRALAARVGVAEVTPVEHSSPVGVVA